MDPVVAVSEQGSILTTRLEEAASALIRVIAAIDRASWDHVPGPGVWSIGKDAEHVSEAAAYHQWIVRLTVGERVAPRRPSIERRLLTSNLSPQDAVDVIRSRTSTGLRLVAGLTDDQLDLPTRPPRAAGAPTLATTIHRVLIGHYDVHRLAIEAKLRS